MSTRSPTASTGSPPTCRTSPHPRASRSTSSWSGPTSRCCSTPGRAGCSRWWPRRWPRVVPVESLRWITFGHVEADECGSMNMWLAAAPQAQVAHGALGCEVSLNDLCDRPPRPLADGEVIDLGGKRVRHIDTPHVPHGWEARVLFEETTGTLLCGDLFTHLGGRAAVTETTSSSRPWSPRTCSRPRASPPHTGASIRQLADLAPTHAGDHARLVVRRGRAARPRRSRHPLRRAHRGEGVGPPVAEPRLSR